MCTRHYWVAICNGSTSWGVRIYIRRARHPNLGAVYVDEMLFSYQFVHLFYVDNDSVCDVETENSSGGGSTGTPAKDALGNDVVAEEWLKNHGPGDRTLTQGLRVIFITMLHKLDELRVFASRISVFDSLMMFFRVIPPTLLWRTTGH